VNQEGTVQKYVRSQGLFSCADKEVVVQLQTSKLFAAKSSKFYGVPEQKRVHKRVNHSRRRRRATALQLGKNLANLKLFRHCFYKPDFPVKTLFATHFFRLEFRQI